MYINPLTQKDGYKVDHRRQYPEGSNQVYTNNTHRSDKLGKYLRDYWEGKITHYGLNAFVQWFLIDTWNNNFFNLDKDTVVRSYKRRIDNYLGKDAITVEHIEELHDLGYLPIVIKSLPEGSQVPIGVPTFTITNTLPEFFWLPNFLETAISSEVWKPTVIATVANQYRKLLTKFAEETGTPTDFVAIQGHDFSARGMSGLHDAGSSGSGHLTSFVGTDTIASIDYVERYLQANSDEELVACSVPATEHSVMCMGSYEDELSTFKRLITEVYPKGVVSIVSDTWDFWKVITEYTKTLKQEILNREVNEIGLAKTVFRPDSGDPVEILCGIKAKTVNFNGDFEEWKEWVADDINNTFTNELVAEDPHFSMEDLYSFNGKYFKVTYTPDLNRHDKTYYYVDNWKDTVTYCTFEEVEMTPEKKGAVECLWDIFGGTVTEEGYKLLNERVGLIYGDAITLERAQEILERLKEKGFASGNVVFGIGSYTYQFNTRDTFGMALKATYGEVNGQGRELFKDPITDSGTKKSAKGLLKVDKDENGDFILVQGVSKEEEKEGELKEIFRDGKLLIKEKLSDIRQRVLES